MSNLFMVAEFPAKRTALILHFLQWSDQSREGKEVGVVMCGFFTFYRIEALCRYFSPFFVTLIFFSLGHEVGKIHKRPKV